jgi:hypothetical protein
MVGIFQGIIGQKFRFRFALDLQQLINFFGLIEVAKRRKQI